MIMESILVALGGFAGAVARYGLSKWVSAKYSNRLPLGTLFVNLAGSFLLGVLAGSGLEREFVLLAGTGFMGAFTTFSTFKVELVQLGMKSKWKPFLVYVGLSYTLGIILCGTGFVVGKEIFFSTSHFDKLILSNVLHFYHGPLLVS